MDLTGKLINNKYNVQDRIEEDSISVKYIASLTNDNTKSVIFDMLKNENISSRIDDIIRFKSDLEVLSRIKKPGIYPLFETGQITDLSREPLHYIIMDYIKGNRLSQILEKDEKLPPESAIDIILETAKALNRVYDEGIIHRSLTPDKIVIRDASDNGKVLVDGFGIAHLQDFNLIKDKKEILRIFSYLSPEQSGIIQRSVDERSDLYSLGIIFYQLLTGKLPYYDNDLTGLIHKHIAVMPVPVSQYNKKVSPALEKIIFKLLEKSPEKRYQHIKGLIYDLEKLRSGILDFPVGKNDKVVKLNYWTDFINRDDELERLKLCFNKAIDNQEGSIIFINGDSGIGKTRLAEEFGSFVKSSKGIFIGVKCFSGDCSIPYSPFKSVFDSYVRQFQTFSKKKKEFVKEELNSTFEDLGQILVKLNPALKKIFDIKDTPVPINPETENIRFHRVICDFLLNLSDIEGMFALFIDDLHWADEGTVDIIKELAEMIKDYPLIVLCCVSPEENITDNGYDQFVDSLYEKKSIFHEIMLQPFSRKVNNLFISRLLYETEDNSLPVSEIIYRKSQGNPLYSVEILKQLVESNAVEFVKDRWTIKKDVIDSFEITDSIVEIILKKIERLGDEHNNLLSLASIVGTKFNLELIFELSELSSSEIVKIIDNSTHMQLIEEMSDTDSTYQFVHERIREAFFSRIDYDSRIKTHLSIAQALEKKYEYNIDPGLYEIANHFIKSKDIKKILQYAYPAAVKAKNNFANWQAISYYHEVIEVILTSGLIEQEKNIFFKCKEGIGEIFLIIGRYDAAIELFNEILPLAETDIQKAKIYNSICSAYYKKGNWCSSEEFGIKGLLFLKEKVPHGNILNLLSIIKEIFARSYNPILRYANKAVQKANPDTISANRYQYMISIYITLNKTYGFTSDMKLVRSIFRMLNFSERKMHDSKELVLANIAYGAMLSYIAWFKTGLKFIKRSIDISQNRGFVLEEGTGYLYAAIAYEWMADYSDAEDYYKKSMLIFKKAGDINQYTMSLFGLIHISYFTARYVDMRRYIGEYREIVSKTKDEYGISAYYVYEMQLDTHEGNFDNVLSIAQKGLSFCKENELWYNYSNILSNLGNLYIELDDPENALNYLSKARDIIEDNSFLKQYSIYVYVFIAHAHILYYMKNKVNFSPGTARDYLSRIKKACNKAIRKTKNWNSHYGSALRAKAMYYNLKGKYEPASKTFLMAIEHCSQYGIKYELAKTVFFYSSFLRENGKIPEGKSRLEYAYRVFKEIGAKYYITKILNTLNVDESDTTFAKKLMDRQRLTSIIKVSQNLSSILNLDDLLKEVLIKAIEITGAQNGYIFIRDEKTRLLELKSFVNNGKRFNKYYSVTIVQDVYRTGKPVMLDNAEQDDDYKDDKPIAKYHLKSILCIPIKYQNDITGVCYLDNPLTNKVFTYEDIEIMGVILNQTAISIESARFFNNFIEIMTSLIASSSTKLYEITEDVMNISVKLARKMELAPREIEEIKIAAILHDLGMLGFIEQIIYSNKILSQKEKKLVESHVQKSIDVIKHLDGMENIKSIIYQHHERYDGNGYPLGLKGSDICIGARIIGLIDDFVSMLTKREFQQLNKKEKIISRLKSMKGIMYDPDIVDNLVGLIDEQNLIYVINEKDIITEYENSEMIWKIPSNINFEPILVEKIMSFINNLELNADKTFSIDYSLAEVIRNAIIHGNKYNEEKQVIVKLSIIELPDDARKITIKVIDQGQGMDIIEHLRFSESRKDLFAIHNKIKEYDKKCCNNDNDEMHEILETITSFRDKYYTDFYTFKTVESSEKTGGVGLLFVQKTFDSVRFNNIIINDRICGLELTLELVV